MHDRYTTPAMAEAWSRPRQLERLHEAAVLAATVTDEEQGLGGALAREVLRVHREYQELDRRSGKPLSDYLMRWHDLEQRLDHDIAAFVELVREQLPDEVARYFHLGRTSSDLVDTALAFAIIDSLELLDTARWRLCTELALVARRYRDAHILGRTHGQEAELTTVGRRFAQLLSVVMGAGWEPYRVAKLTGPVGTRSNTESARVLYHAGLRAVPSTQIVPRYYLARLMGELSAATVPLSDLAMLIRLGSRGGREAPSWVREGRRGSEARGSSAMPVKRNPIRTERASGLLIYVRSTAGTVIEASSGLWEERDISHSSVERVGLPAVFAALEFVYRDLAEVVRRLEVDEDAMIRPSALPNTSAAALERLVASHGMSYAEAYRLVADVGPDEAVDGVRLAAPYDPSSERTLWAAVESVLADRPDVAPAYQDTEPPGDPL